MSKSNQHNRQLLHNNIKMQIAVSQRSCKAYEEDETLCKG